MRIGKRGMEDKLIFVTWELIVILLVVITLTVSVRGLANNNTYWKRYHATDLALMTDLMFAHQGDFVINYDMKDIQKNFVTKNLHINPLVFQTFLKESSFFVYDNSIDDDRFPQSYVFASSTNIRTIPSNMTSDYIVLYKSGADIRMKSTENAKQVTCSAIDTSGDVTTMHFKAIGLSDMSSNYGSYITTSLETLGTGLEDELLIGILMEPNGKIVTYFDTSATSQGQSEKMSCLVMKYISLKYPDLEVSEKAYTTALDTDSFGSEREKYMQWIAVSVNDDIPVANLSQIIRDAIEEYYQAD